MKTHTVAILLTCLSIIGKNVLAQLPGLPGGGAGGLPFKLPAGLPGAGGGAGGMPQLPQLGSPEQKACFQAFTDAGGQTCLQHMKSSFETKKLSVDPSCCSYISKVSGSCKSLLHFGNAGFEDKISQFCSSAAGGGGGATPAA